MRRKPYKEGDWFAVPLPAGYVLGRIARVGRRGGILLGYFFEPIYATVPALSEISHLRPEDAFFIRQFCDPGLIDDGWPIIASSEPWSRADWPMPLFGRIDKFSSGRGFAVRYDENDLSVSLSQVPITTQQAIRLPQECMAGHRTLQDRLEMYFRDGQKVRNVDDSEHALIWYLGQPSTEQFLRLLGNHEAEIDTAATELNLTSAVFRKCTDDVAEEIIRRTKAAFVEGNSSLWWFALKSVVATYHYDDSGFHHLAEHVPSSDEPFWFIPDIGEHYPLVYEVRMPSLVDILRNCSGFPYYLVGKQLDWLVAEDDSDILYVCRSSC